MYAFRNTKKFSFVECVKRICHRNPKSFVTPLSAKIKISDIDIVEGEENTFFHPKRTAFSGIGLCRRAVRKARKGRRIYLTTTCRSERAARGSRGVRVPGGHLLRSKKHRPSRQARSRPLPTALCSSAESVIVGYTDSAESCVTRFARS